MSKHTATQPSTNSPRRHFFGRNFGIVYKFEVTRTLKKPSFWISILALPLLLAVIFGISFLSGMSASDSEETVTESTTTDFSIAITDDSHLINQQLIDQLGIRTIDNKEQGVDMVRNSQIDAYFYYPADLANDSVDVYGQNASVFDYGKYSSFAESLLKSSVQTTSDANVAVVLSDSVTSSSHYYKDGQEYNPLNDVVVPVLFLVLFYLIICVFSNQMLTSTVEEKENRITEMLLTTIQSRTLITGKIFAFISLIFIQVLIIIGLLVGGYLIAAHYLALPTLDLSFVTIDPAKLAISIAIFIVSTLMYSGILVAVGAAAPTAKEASSFMSVPILLLMAPFLIFSTVMTTPDAPVVIIMTYCPLTAPIMLMMLSALGTLTITNAVIGLIIMTITTIAIFIVAARLFQASAVDYHKRIKLFNKRSLTRSQ